MKQRLVNSMKFPNIIVVFFVAIFAGIGAYFILFSHAATATTYYVATTGSDSNPCSQTAPCLGFNRAYQVAAPGDTVQVAGGVYNGTQTIAWDSTKASATSNVTFQPASGATVNVKGNIVVQSSHVTFQNMSLVDPANSNNKFDVEADVYPLGGAQPSSPSAANNVGFITFQNIIGRNFNVSGAHDVSVIGGSYGPASACGSGKPTLTQYGGGNNALRTALMTSGHVDPNNILIDGVTVHNIMSYDLVGCHTEGVAIFSGSNVTIRNSKFYGNDVYDILAQANSGSGALGQITLQNNWFGQSTNSGGTGSGSNGVEFDDNKDIAVNNNSFNDGLLFLAGPTFSNVSISGNIVIGPVYASSSIGSMCGASGVTAQYNITTSLSGLHCTSSTNTEVSSASSFYVNPSSDASMDYSLKTGSSAIGFVPTSASPVTNDINYHCRPASGQTNIDAGASELGATGSCGLPSGGTSSGGGGTTTPPADTTPPTVSVTAPANNATISGTVNVAANATDNVGVASVQFKLSNSNGSSNLGSPITTSPYSYSWDTTKVANGTYTLTAVATDTAVPANTATSSPLTVTVNNTTTTPPPPTTAGCTNTVSTASTLTSAVGTAAGGSTICVTGGSYGAMTWNGGTSRTSKVIVKPADSTPVTFTGTLTINGSQIEVQNISLAGQLYQINAPAHDVQMTNITAGHFIIEANSTSGAQNITLKGGSIGPWSSYPDNWIVSTGGSIPNKNIMIDGVTIHDFMIPYSQLSTTHFECLQVWAADGLTVQNSTFKNCSVFDMFIQAAGSGQPPAPTNVLIQNNYLDCCSYSDVGYKPNFAIQLPTDHGEGAWNNITIRNNSGDDGYLIGSGPAATFSNDFIENNIAPNLSFSLPSSPPSGLKTDYNLWYSGSKVGTHDLNNVSPSSLFANYGAQNFDLIPGAPAIDHGDPGYYSPTDRYGTTRPQGAAPDIGANEYVGSTVTPPPTTNPLVVSVSSPANQATVTGTVTVSATTSGGSGSISSVQFQADGTAISTDTTSPYSASLDTTKLTNGTHTLTAVATDGSGATASGSVVVTVNNGDTTPPTTPSGLTAQAASYKSVNLAWTASTDNVGVAGYYIVRGGTTIAQTTGTGTTYTDNSVNASSSYSYQVIAYDAKGNLSGASNTATVTTPATPDTTPPSAPANLTAQVVSSSQINLSWTASTDNVGVVAYDVYQGANKIASVSTTSFGSTGLSPATSYSYYVIARDAAGNQSNQSNIATGITSASSAITGSNLLQPNGDYNTAGQAEAFKVSGAATSTANALSAYVDTSTSATKLTAGVYAATSTGKPGALLASGTISNLQKGAWNSLRLSSSITITAGKTYWIALLGQGGTLYFRDGSNGASQLSKSTSLTSLPSKWSNGATYPDGPVSAYLFQN